MQYNLSILSNYTKHDNLNVAYSIPLSEEAQLVITDLSGRLIRQQKLDPAIRKRTIQLDVNQLNSGFYILHLISDEDKMARKFIVQQ